MTRRATTGHHGGASIAQLPLTAPIRILQAELVHTDARRKKQVARAPPAEERGQNRRALQAKRSRPGDSVVRRMCASRRPFGPEGTAVLFFCSPRRFTRALCVSLSSALCELGPCNFLQLARDPVYRMRRW
jgi:hypothetical protein